MLATMPDIRRYVAPNDPRYDADSDAERDDLIEAIAAHEWIAHVGDAELPAGMVGDAIVELTDEWMRDAGRMRELGEAHTKGPDALGQWLHPQIEGFWRKWCRDKAEGYVSLMEREAQDEAAAARMGN